MTLRDWLDRNQSIITLIMVLCVVTVVASAYLYGEFGPKKVYNTSTTVSFEGMEDGHPSVFTEEGGYYLLTIKNRPWYATDIEIGVEYNVTVIENVYGDKEIIRMSKRERNV